MECSDSTPDAASQNRLVRLRSTSGPFEGQRNELAELEDRSNVMTATWQAEKDRMQDTQKLKERLDQARSEAEVAHVAAI